VFATDVAFLELDRVEALEIGHEFARGEGF
jgi:hypothetical protein